jgi:hypothetical protein
MFFTPVHIPPAAIPLKWSHAGLTMGSCFADAIGDRMRAHKWPVLCNPFGTLYNPISIAKVLTSALNSTPLDDSGYLTREGIFYHFDLHSEFAATHLEDLQQKAKNALLTTAQHLEKAHWIIITLGTAWVYQHIDSQLIVANCHKVPTNHFQKQLLSQKQVLDHLEPLFQKLLLLRPGVQIILTVSPVRHVKDTLPLNAVSKSVLRLACHSLQEQFPQVHYFPAYELMMDELRDYRFYKTDRIHPTEEAEDLIWERFGKTWWEEDTLHHVQNWAKINKSLAHKPFLPEHPSHQKFLRSLQNQVMAYEGIVDVSEELATIHRQLLPSS